MRAHPNSRPPSDLRTPNRGSTWVVIALLTSVAGCAEAAGLEEHTRYLGFPDSLSVPCSNGLLTVNCDVLSTSAPQDGHTLNAKPVYEVSGADVIDKITSLSWYRTPGGPQNHDQAVEYCDVLPGKLSFAHAYRIDFAAGFSGRIAGPNRQGYVSGRQTNEVLDVVTIWGRCQ